MAFICNQCGSAFGRSYDLIRHQKALHPEDEEEEEEEDTESVESEENDKENSDEGSGKDDSSSEGDEEESSDIEDNSVFRGWYEEALAANNEERIEKYQKYLQEGMDESRARKKAYAKTLYAIKGDFFDYFGTFLEEDVIIRETDVYHDIAKDIDEKTANGMDTQKAVKRVLSRNKRKFDGLFEYDENIFKGEDVEDNQEETPDPPSAKRPRLFH